MPRKVGLQLPVKTQVAVCEQYSETDQSPSEIAMDAGISLDMLYKILRVWRVPLKGRPTRVTDETVAAETAVVEAYTSGKQLIDIEIELGKSPPTIYKILRKHNVPLRNMKFNTRMGALREARTNRRTSAIVQSTGLEYDQVMKVLRDAGLLLFVVDDIGMQRGVSVRRSDGQADTSAR